jgi:neutral ceramidase
MKRYMLLVGIGLLCVSGQVGTQAFAAESQSTYRVGLARQCITPDESLWMAGYLGRRQPSQGVLDDLYAQALAIEDSDGHRALLLAVDLCILRTATVSQVCQRISKRTGLTREQILVNVSHTHSGPAVDQLDDGYPMSSDDRKKLAAYTERVKTHLVNVAEAALSDLEPAELAFGVGAATFFENRRRLNADGGYIGMAPNPQNHTDRDVPVLRITRLGGELRAVVFGAACHNVTLGGNSYKISGDYSGAARVHIETERRGVEAVFITGCGADANPHPRSSADQEDWVTRHGESLGNEVLDVISRPMQPVSGSLRTTFAFVDLSLREVPSRSELTQMRRGPISESHGAGLMLAALDRG